MTESILIGVIFIGQIMTRKNWIDIHLYISTFFLPLLLLFSITGTLYMLGEKGSESRELVLTFEAPLSKNIDKLQLEINEVLKSQNIKPDYEYLKLKGGSIYLRPTSRNHYMIKRGSPNKLYKVQPSAQKLFMELHKGHGPTLFKYFSILFGFSFLVIVFSGAYLGISNKALRKKTIPALVAGIAVTGILILLYN